MAEAVWRSEDVSPRAARWVMSAAGRAVLDRLLAADEEDPLAVASRLRAEGLDPERAATAQGVATASRRAHAAGLPADTWWTPAAAEQASHPVVGEWRSRRFAGVAAVDVTAGCGADALALAAATEHLVACERSPSRVPFLRANLPSHVPVARGDATRPCVAPSRWAWADPGRRVAGRRVRGLGDTVPAVPDLVAHPWAALGIAVSPAVDLEDPARPAAAELEFVQVGRQLVEATLWLGALRDTGPGPGAPASATLLPEGVHVRGTPSAPEGPGTPVGDWLAEPAPALVRARLVDTVAAEHGLARVANRRALFTGPLRVDSPWFRLERVEAVVGARPARVRDALDGLEPQPLEILTHGLSVDLRAWWRALGDPDRGPQGRAVHLVRLDRGSIAVLTRRDTGG
jgi:hypothetical protein